MTLDLLKRGVALFLAVYLLVTFVLFSFDYNNMLFFETLLFTGILVSMIFIYFCEYEEEPEEQDLDENQELL